MTGTITALHIVGAGVNGAFGLFSLMSLWGINRSAREKAAGNISMTHGSQGAPLYGGFIGNMCVMLMYLLSYIFDGTAMTIFSHTPPTFVAAGGAQVYSYEILFLTFWISSLVVPSVVSSYRHKLTPGFTAGIAAIGVLLSIVATFCHFQMKSDTFYGLSYTAVGIVGIGIYLVISSYSNIASLDNYTRAGAITVWSMVGFIVFLVLEMCFAFWFNLWTQQSSIALEFAIANVIGLGIPIAAQASTYATLEEMMAHGKSVFQNIGNAPGIGGIGGTI